MALNFGPFLTERGIKPRGIIHVGAHEGQELDEYRALGVSKILFIEANPEVYARLAAKVGNMPGVGAINCAIVNYDGTANLRVTSMTQSSSLLKLKVHSDIYPAIVETHQVQVPARRIDTLISELHFDPRDFNLLNLDIQGSELAALQGASRQLGFIEAIRSEVNFAELYEGCPLVGDLDSFLGTRGYKRLAVEQAYHPTWGDAMYVGSPMISMGSIGQHGRWGNQLFQYMFAKVYAHIHGLDLQMSAWEGTPVFGCSEPPVTFTFTPAAEWGGEFAALLADPLAPGAIPLSRVDLMGYFQFHTRRYAPFRAYIRELFKPAPAVAQAAEAAMGAVRAKGKTVFAIHLRRGDYTVPCSQSFVYVPPNEWYLRWLELEWPKADNPVLYIASDDAASVVGDFEAYKPLTADRLGVELPQPPHYMDYHVLRHADRVAISNSSFSFHACMLNEVASQFVRPSRATRSLIPFDPWDSKPVLSLPEG